MALRRSVSSELSAPWEMRTWCWSCSMALMELTYDRELLDQTANSRRLLVMNKCDRLVQAGGQLSGVAQIY
jgi:hypothetical protein